MRELRAKPVLARSARRADDGTVDLAGAGLAVVHRGADVVVVSFVEVPKDQTEVVHKVRVEVIDAHGAVVGRPIAKAKTIDASSRRGRRQTMVAVLVSKVKTGDLDKGEFEVRVSVDEISHDDWRCPLVVT